MKKLLIILGIEMSMFFNYMFEDYEEVIVVYSWNLNPVLAGCSNGN